jgi:amino acid transporter
MSIDNEYVRALLQGGSVYLALLVVALGFAASWVARSDGPSTFVGIATIAISVNAVTSLPMASPAMAVVWFFIGVSLACRSASATEVQRHARELRAAYEGPNGVTVVPEPFSNS